MWNHPTLAWISVTGKVTHAGGLKFYSKSQFEFVLIYNLMGSHSPTQFHTTDSYHPNFNIGKTIKYLSAFCKKNSSNKTHAKTLRLVFGEGRASLVNAIKAPLVMIPLHSSDRNYVIYKVYIMLQKWREVQSQQNSWLGA